MKSKKQDLKIRLISLLISILFHIGLFLFLLFRNTFSFDKLVKMEPEPKIKENRIEFELIETPNELDETTTEIPFYASDKNQKAKNPTKKEKQINDQPYSETNEKIPQIPQEKSNPVFKAKDNNFFSTIDQLTLQNLSFQSKDLNFAERFKQQKDVRKESKKQLESAVRDFGGLQFNTYDWDFAPYLLEMKKKIESKINPPFAFTHMGMISGEAKIQFIIEPSGFLKELKILDSKGHESLTLTSQKAIEWATPFMPLPSDFPEDKLIVTATFHYTIKK